MRLSARSRRRRIRRAARTSISGAIEFGAALFENSGYRGIRRVIDVSGDGANNNGPLVTVTRDDAVAKGITINGLPIVAKRLNYATMDIEKLDIYYEDCVIGGPGAFVIPIESATSSSRRRAPSWCWKSPAACRRRASSRSPPTSRACPAPSASGCGRSAGGIDAVAFHVGRALTASRQASRVTRDGNFMCEVGQADLVAYPAVTSMYQSLKLDPRLQRRQCNHSPLERRHDLDMRGVFELIDRRHRRQACSRHRSGFSHRARRSRHCTTPRSPAALCSWRVRAPARRRPDAADRKPRRRMLFNSGAVSGRRKRSRFCTATGFSPARARPCDSASSAASSLSIAVTFAFSARRSANGPTPQNRSAMVFDFPT